MELKRLFDIPYYQKEKYPRQDAITAKENGKWHSYSTDECIQYINKVSFALMASNILPGDKISIIANNRPEWNFIDYGAMQAGVVNVPVYPTISEDDYVYIFNDAETKIVFVSSEELYNKVQNIRNRVPSIKEVFTFNEVAGATHWTQFLKRGENGDATKLEAIKSSIHEEDISTIIYTSGTSGFPKGVMLSHKNVMADILGAKHIMPVDQRHRAISFLPLNHSFEKMIVYLYMTFGLAIYYAESIDTLGDNIREVKPHIFTAVPRVVEKVYEKIIAKGMELKRIKRALFFWAVRLGEKWDNQNPPGGLYMLKLKIARKLIFSKWLEALGGQTKLIVTGSAPMQQKLLRVFTAAGIRMMEGYGLTETSPAMCVNRYNLDENMIGTVGKPLDGVQVKIAEDGEILCKGDIVMMGYYKRPDLTAEAIDKDGWLKTGDIGEFINGEYLKITDRKKELLKTSGGKYVAPQPVENKFKESPLIEQMMVVGDKRKFVTALIVPTMANLKNWCEKKNLKFNSVEEMLQSSQVIKKYQEIVDEMNGHFGHIEQIKKFRLIKDEWTTLGGELTPTLKLKRRILEKKYESVIDSMYGENISNEV